MDNELMHYGKLGMKWGQRNATKQAEYSKLKRSQIGLFDKKNANKANYRLEKNRAIAKYGKADEKAYATGNKAGLKKANMEYKASIKSAKSKLKALNANANDTYWKNNAEAIFGDAGVKRINKRIEKGMSPQQARKTEVGAQIAGGLLSMGALYTVAAVAGYKATRKLMS